jgi:hypothetical protein
MGSSGDLRTYEEQRNDPRGNNHVTLAIVGDLDVQPSNASWRIVQVREL